MIGRNDVEGCIVVQNVHVSRDVDHEAIITALDELGRHLDFAITIARHSNLTGLYLAIESDRLSVFQVRRRLVKRTKGSAL